MTIDPFTGNPTDNQLELVGDFLEEISETDDVRHVMERFREYQAPGATERNFDARDRTVQKQIETKFMKTLHKRWPSRGPSFFLGSQDNCEDIDENEEGEEVSYKLQMINYNQEKSILSELNTTTTSSQHFATDFLKLTSKMKQIELAKHLGVY